MRPVWRTNLCIPNSSLLPMKGALVHVRGTYRLLTGVAQTLTDPSCAEPSTVELVDDFHTNGDATVTEFLESIEKRCSRVSGPCAVNANVSVMAEIREYDGRAILELKRIEAADFKRP